jgi:PIN domain nuclease of toxin-antitoxin system
VVGWLYEGVEHRLPTRARELIESEPPSISPLVELELAYLYEVRRVTEPASVPLAALRQAIGLTIGDVSLAELAHAATDLTWTRDPFDRLIAAQAIVANAPLVTADRKILANLPLATWD